jgi:signal transduction histidine kinase
LLIGRLDGNVRNMSGTRQTGGVEIDTPAICSAVDRSPLAVAIVSSSTHNLRYANKAFHELAGPAREAILGKPLSEIVQNLNEPDTLARLGQVYQTGLVTTLSERHDGRGATPGAWLAWPIDHAGARPTALCLLRLETDHPPPERSLLDELTGEIRKINERLLIAGLHQHERAEERAVLLERAEQDNRLKASFLAMISHELRTPLNAVLGYADLLAGGVGGQLNDIQKLHVKGIESGTRHLMELIEEILSFARLEAGRPHVQVARTDATELASEAASLIQPLARKAKLSFGVLAPPIPLFIQTDAGKVRQILINLLGNAVKFTERGGVCLEVSGEANDVLFAVSDTGIGIPRELSEQIFEPFRQVVNVSPRLESGSGLGLSVSRQLARLLGGDLTVASELGEGSTFTLRLPSRMLRSA